jgi:hypothetical protein
VCDRQALAYLARPRRLCALAIFEHRKKQMKPNIKRKEKKKKTPPLKHNKD